MLQGGEQGVLSVGCGPIPAETLAGDALGRFNTRYPHMTVKVTVDHVSNLTKLLHNRAIDFFVAEAYQIAGMEEYEIVSMPQQQGYFCCRNKHPLEGRSPLTIGDILAFPLALMWLSERIYALLGTLTGTAIQKSEDLGAGLIECDNMNILLRIVCHSDAVTITSREIVAESSCRDRVHLLPLVIPALKSSYAIVGLKAFSTIPAIAALKNCFLETASQKVQPD